MTRKQAHILSRRLDISGFNEAIPERMILNIRFYVSLGKVYAYIFYNILLASTKSRDPENVCWQRNDVYVMRRL